MAKPNLGGKRAKSSKSEPVVFAGKTKSQIESSVIESMRVSVMPKLTGSDDNVKNGTIERDSLAKEMLKYASTRDSDGNPLALPIQQKLLWGSKSDIADFCVKRADSLTFGNPSLQSQKLNQVIKSQNDVAQRHKRLIDIFANRTNANFWIGKDNVYYYKQMKDYIDGKINNITWR